MDLPRLAQILQTDLDCSSLSACAFPFRVYATIESETLSGFMNFPVVAKEISYAPLRSEYDVYRHFLNALSANKLTGQVLVFAGIIRKNEDAKYISNLLSVSVGNDPVLVLVVVPVLGDENKKLKGITRQEYNKLRDDVKTATDTDDGILFIYSNSQLRDASLIADDILPLSGNIEFQEGKATKLVWTSSEPSPFERECLAMYSGIPIENVI